MSRPVVAAFDFDGTLTDGGSVWPYLAAMTGRTKVLGAGIAVFPKLVSAALIGGVKADRAKEALFGRTIAGMDAAELGRRSVEFGLSHYRRHARADVRARLEWHRAEGHAVVIVSASPTAYVTAVGDELGADAVLATRLESDDGTITGHYDGKNCRGEEKVARLEAWVDEHVRPGADDEPYVWAYGNSAGDRRLLALADIGVDVGRLGRFGKLRHYPRLRDLARRDSSTGTQPPGR